MRLTGGYVVQRLVGLYWYLHLPRKLALCLLYECQDPGRSLAVDDRV